MKEEKKSLGCTVSRVFVRYPQNLNNEKIDGYFKNLAEAFFKFATDIAFKKKEYEFSIYIENGGRRSLFPSGDYKFEIEIIGIFKSFISTKTLATVTENGYVSDYRIFYEVFDTKSGIICNASDFFKKKPKIKYNGFYLRDGKVFFCNTPDVDNNRNLKISDLSKSTAQAENFKIEKIPFFAENFKKKNFFK